MNYPIYGPQQAHLCVKYPYIQPGHKIHIQAPILPVARYYETSPNDSP
jgi:hypothetical protein